MPQAKEISEHLRLRTVDCVKLERVTKKGFGAELVFVFVSVLYVKTVLGPARIFSKTK